MPEKPWRTEHPGDLERVTLGSPRVPIQRAERHGHNEFVRLIDSLP